MNWHERFFASRPGSEGGQLPWHLRLLLCTAVDFGVGLVALIYSFDWSGRDGHGTCLDGIACYKGASGETPTLTIPPTSKHWSRSLVCAHLVDLAALAVQNRERVIAGSDFPFSFPWIAANGRFPCGHSNRATFWQHVHSVVWPNGLAQDFVDLDPSVFAQNGKPGANYVNHFRCTEQAAQDVGAPAKGEFNLRGPSPGKGAICGIAVLQELVIRCQRGNLPVMVWPFFLLLANGSLHDVDIMQPELHLPEGCLIVLETYPRVHWVRSGQQLANFANPSTWIAVQRFFDNLKPLPGVPTGKDQADALVAWYGLTRHRNIAAVLAPSHAMLKCHAIHSEVVQQEGWIHGV